MNEIELLTLLNENVKKLLGVTAVQGMDDTKKIKTLQGMGFNSREIHEITGIPIPTVKAKWAKKSNKTEK
ncbi:MAG TPA: hypothetical protein VIU12_21190 [Chryseolinea sp.]